MAHVTGGPAPGDHVETSLAVRQVLLALCPHDRSIIVEIFYHGRSGAEVAALLGIPETAVRSRVYDALRTIREMMRSGDDPK